MARHFNGAGNKIEWGNVTFANGLATATWVAWVRPDWFNCQNSADAWRKDGSFSPLQRNAGVDEFRSVVWANGFLQVVPGSGYAWTTNTWHFAALRFDPANAGTDDIVLYAAQKADVALTVAGTTSISPTDTIDTSANQMRAGTDDSGAGEFFAGDIAFYGFVDQALTTAQLLAIRDDPNVLLSYGSHLKFYARLCGTDNPEPDASGNSITGTVTGATATTSPYDALCAGTPDISFLSGVGW